MKKTTYILFICFLIILAAGCRKKEKSPDPAIVAQFKDGQVTREEVQEQIALLIQEAPPEVVKQIQHRDVYEAMIRRIALDSMIMKKIKAVKLDAREEVKHAMKHVSEELNIDELHSRAHKSKIKISEADIRSFYEDNREQFMDVPLIEVKDEIRSILQPEKEKEYFEDYMEELKKNAVITREDSLLNIPEPSETDYRIYYEENRKRYGAPGKSFSEMRDQIAIDLNRDETEKWFKQNHNRTLFTIHGKQHTVGEFYTEFKELEPEDQEQYRSFEGMKQLVDKVIDRLLVVEDTYDQMLDSKTREETAYVKEDILRQLLHQEEVDDNLEISDEEVESYYNLYKQDYVEPPEAKISYIRIDYGQTEDEMKRAGELAQNAFKKLVPGFFRKGEPFDKVAREYSEDAETAELGGKFNSWISESDNLFEEIVSHTFHENALSLPVGGISRPFRFEGSWYIVMVRERKEAKAMLFEDAREHIKVELKTKKHEELTHSMSEALLVDANLVIYDDVVKSMLEEE